MDNGTFFLKRQDRTDLVGFSFVKDDLLDLYCKSNLLHSKEKSQLISHKFNNRKLSYLLGRITSKLAIGQIFHVEDFTSILITKGVFGFPVVKNIPTNIQVSISHCDNIGLAVAFDEEHPLGIDLERIDRKRKDLLLTQITEKEIELILSNELTLLVGATLVWTAKEALSKVIKTGMTLDFKFMEVKSIEKVGTTYTSKFQHFSQYKAISSVVSNIACSLVLPKKTEASLQQFWSSLEHTVLH